MGHRSEIWRFFLEREWGLCSLRWTPLLTQPTPGLAFANREEETLPWHPMKCWSLPKALSAHKCCFQKHGRSEKSRFTWLLRTCALFERLFPLAMSKSPIHNNAPESFHAKQGTFARNFACLTQLYVVISLVTMSYFGQEPPISY